MKTILLITKIVVAAIFLTSCDKHFEEAVPKAPDTKPVIDLESIVGYYENTGDSVVYRIQISSDAQITLSSYEIDDKEWKALPEATYDISYDSELELFVLKSNDHKTVELIDPMDKEHIKTMNAGLTYDKVKSFSELPKIKSEDKNPGEENPGEEIPGEDDQTPKDSIDDNIVPLIGEKYESIADTYNLQILFKDNSTVTYSGWKKDGNDWEELSKSTYNYTVDTARNIIFVTNEFEAVYDEIQIKSNTSIYSKSLDVDFNQVNEFTGLIITTPMIPIDRYEPGKFESIVNDLVYRLEIHNNDSSTISSFLKEGDSWITLKKSKHYTKYNPVNKEYTMYTKENRVIDRITKVDPETLKSSLTSVVYKKVVEFTKPN